MAQAKKCDRCDILYEPYKGKNTIRTFETPCSYREYDLCPACMNWLQRFLNSKGKLKEAE